MNFIIDKTIQDLVALRTSTRDSFVYSCWVDFSASGGSNFCVWFSQVGCVKNNVFNLFILEIYDFYRFQPFGVYSPSCANILP